MGFCYGGKWVMTPTGLEILCDLGGTTLDIAPDGVVYVEEVLVDGFEVDDFGEGTRRTGGDHRKKFLKMISISKPINVLISKEKQIFETIFPLTSKRRANKNYILVEIKIFLAVRKSKENFFSLLKFKIIFLIIFICLFQYFVI